MVLLDIDLKEFFFIVLSLFTAAHKVVCEPISCWLSDIQTCFKLLWLLWRVRTAKPELITIMKLCCEVIERLLPLWFMQILEMWWINCLLCVLLPFLKHKHQRCNVVSPSSRWFLPKWWVCVCVCARMAVVPWGFRWRIPVSNSRVH